MARIQRNRPIRWAVAAAATALFLTILSSPTFQSVTGGLEASAQGMAGPPKDTAPLRAGQRVEKPFGALEISSFTQTQKDQDLIFRVEFLVRNEKSPQRVDLYLGDYLRLIADGVPRAPESYSNNTGAARTAVERDSAEYSWVTFRVRGQPHDVYVVFGTPEEGRSYLHWPR